MIKKIFLLSISVFFALGIAELVYRMQWFDFYSTELQALNSKDGLLVNGRKKILVLGDSFSADTASYVGKLQLLFPPFDFINAAIPGTGIRETKCIAKNRIERFKPSVVIYQIYVGNDLFDIRKPLDGNISMTRKIFWWLTDRSLFLRYINYKAGQLKNSLGINPIHDQYRNEEKFSPKEFSNREKLLLQAEPLLIENSVLLKNGREVDAEELVDGLEELSKLTRNENAQLIVLLIPHCAQVNEDYLNKMVSVGAQFTSNAVFQKNNFVLYSFIKEKLKAEQIEILHPLQLFHQIDSSGNLLYYQNDIHLNTKGQKVIADFLSSTLQNELR
ncbi:MAG: hypothetical protein NTY88_08025 [Bacteroidetes bacterium]|nr:hypothetical protein [Bacteroidota bacterium]